MAIRLRHDAAAVALPSVSEGGRKYGQQMVLQEQQQKYNAQQAGYDRLLTLGRDQQQRAFQMDRDQGQQAFIQGRDKAQNEFQTERMRQAQRASDFAAARARVDTYAKDALNDPATPPELRQKIQSLISGKMTVLSGGYNEAEQQEFLDQYNSQLTALLKEMPPKAPPPTRDEQLKTFLGGSYDQYGNLPWVPDGKGGFSVSKEALEQQQKEMELQQKMRPKSFQDYYSENEDKFQKDLDATMTSMEKIDPKTGKVTTATPEQALEKMQKDYEFRQKALGRPQYGTPTEAPAMPGAAAPSDAAPSFAPGSMLGDQASALGMNPSRSILEAPSKDYSAQNRVSELLGQRPVDPNAPAPVPRGAPPMPTPAQPQSEPLPLPLAPNAQPPAAADATVGRQATSRFTPPGLSPKDAEVRQQMLDMPMDQRITSLMPHSSDPLLKGRTLNEALADPEVRKIYDEEIVADAKKRGVKPPEYREAMLAVFDEALTGEVLNGGVSMPQQSYAGMHVDDIKDPKAKAEVDKMPRPKGPDEIPSIRGPYFVDPNGIIRSTKKQT